MKILEIILNAFIRILNIPLCILTIVLFVIYDTLLLFIAIPLEFLTVTSIYYIITGEWYYNSDNIKYPYDHWFPIAGNMETYCDHFPILLLPEINLSKYYGRDKEHTSL